MCGSSLTAMPVSICTPAAATDRCYCTNEQLEADFDRFESHTDVVAGLVPATQI
jgi:hypothetical protein